MVDPWRLRLFPLLLFLYKCSRVQVVFDITLIKPNSPKQLEKSLQFFFKKKKLFYRKSRIAQKKIKKKFSNEIMGKNYFEFFKKIKSY